MWGYCSAVLGKGNLFFYHHARACAYFSRKNSSLQRHSTLVFPYAEMRGLRLASAMKARIDQGLSLLFAYLGKIDLADYLHSDRSSIIGCNDFVNSFHDTSTLKSSQWLEHSHVESVSILGRRIGLPKPSTDPDF